MRIDDIVNKVFARSFMGYDIEQVDLFLDEIIERFEQYESEKKEMLLAMEYLLNKLENNQKLPITEMRKAIDTGKTQKKRLPQSGSPTAAESVVERLGTAPAARKDTKPARSIARGAQPPKPVRAPKISRMRAEQEQPKKEPQKEAAMTQQKAVNALGTEPNAGTGTTPNDAPAAENWLDELLMNLIEREKVGYGESLQTVRQPDCDNGDIDLDGMHADAARDEEVSAIEEEPR